MIEIIGFRSAVLADDEPLLGAENGSGELHDPAHGASGIGIDSTSGEDAGHLGVISGMVASRHGDAETRNMGAASGAGHVAQTDANVEVMAAAGTSANGGTSAAVAVGQDVAAGANDQRLRAHS